jgi:hypothetical protein
VHVTWRTMLNNKHICWLLVPRLGKTSARQLTTQALGDIANRLTKHVLEHPVLLLVPCCMHAMYSASAAGQQQ